MTAPTSLLAWRAPAIRAVTWRPLASAGPAATAAFALLILGCVFLAVAGPRESSHMRTQALHSQLAAASASQRTVELTAAPWQLAGALPGTRVMGGSQPIPAAQLARLRDAIARTLAATPLPLGPLADDWVSVETGRSPVSGAAASAVIAGTPPQLEVRYASALGRYSHLVAGRYPRAARERFAHDDLKGTVTAATFEVAVTQATAARFGLHPGSRLTATAAGAKITVMVTGIMRPVDPGASFWDAVQAAAAPARIPPTPASPPYWLGVAYAGTSEVLAIQAALSGSNTQLNWDYPLNLSGLPADRVPALAAHLDRIGSRALPLPGALNQVAGNLTLASAGPQALLTGFLATQAGVQAILSLLFTGLTVIGAVAVLLAAQLMAGRRETEFALIRARGATVYQVAGIALRDGAAVAVPAAAAGAGLAVLVTPGAFPVLAWWLAGLVLLASLVCLPVAAAAANRHVTTRHRSPGRRSRTSRVLSQRWVTEAALTAVAAGGLVVLRDQGLSAGRGVNVYSAAAPVLVAVPGALLVMRGYPLLVAGLLRLSGRRARAAWFIALSRAARARPVRTLPVFALVIALVLAAFAGMIRAAVSRGEAAASWQRAGADAVLDSSGGIGPAAARAVAAVPGVTHAAPARVMTWARDNGGPVRVAAVDPASYAAFTAATPWPKFPARLLAGPRGAGGTAQPVPAVASPAVREAIGPGTVTITTDSGPLKVRVTGTLARTPALPGASSFLVVPLPAIRARTGLLPPTEMLLTGPHLDRRRLATTVHRLLPGANLTLRSALLAALASAPLQHGTYLLYAAGIGAAAALSVLVLLLALALTARERELTLMRLATMGLGAWRLRLAAVGEALPTVIAAAAAGAACAWALTALVGPALNLAVFTGSAATVTVRPGLGAVVLPPAVLAVLAVVTLTAEVSASRHRGLASALRIGT